MKTSEFIRAAVDAHLAPDLISGKRPDEECALCLVFQAAAQRNPAQKECASKATRNVLHAFYEVSSLYSTIARYLQDTDPDIYLGDGGHKIQSVRFMFAEFIALMLEDEGD